MTNHANNTREFEIPAAAEPRFAERARTLMHIEPLGTLSTLSRRWPGFPYGSVMPYAQDERGRPIFLISTMAMHTQNLQADPRASLLVRDTHAKDPLASARVTLLGHTSPVPDSESSAVRQLYLNRHHNSQQWVDFDDFSFYRMEVVDVYYVGGFGVMGWINASEYLAAEPDPLAEVAPSIISHMNADHPDALVLLARYFAGIDSQEAVMTSVDRLGFELRMTEMNKARNSRIRFPREVRSTADARSALVEMVALAKKKS